MPHARRLFDAAPLLGAKIRSKGAHMTSLSRNARIAGLLYLTLLTAPLRLIYIPSKLFVAGNASATANNITAHEMLFRLGIVSDLFTATMAIFFPLPAVPGSGPSLGSADGNPRRADGDA